MTLCFASTLGRIRKSRVNQSVGLSLDIFGERAATKEGMLCAMRLPVASHYVVEPIKHATVQERSSAA